MTKELDESAYRRRWYRLNKKVHYLYFDKKHSFKQHFGHKNNSKTFLHHKNILLFLEVNPDSKIFFTLDDDVKNFQKVAGGFLINMSAYTDFCKLLNNSDGGKVSAFLGQNLSINDINITAEDNEQYVKNNTSEKLWIDIFRQFDSTTQAKLIEQLVGNEEQSKPSLSAALSQVHSVSEDDIGVALSKTAKPIRVNAIVKHLSIAELGKVSGTYKHDLYKSELANLEKLLDLEMNHDIVAEIEKHGDLAKYKAGQPEKIFQNWIESNQWIFGIEYIKKYDARRIGFFSDSDILMESMDGYLDLIELKRPKLKSDLLVYDKSHKSYFPSADLSSAIGQSLYYLKTLEDTKLIVEKEHKAQVIMPRVKIIAGRSSNFNNEQFAALRILNSNLGRIQVVSYDYLLSCGKQIIKTYENV